MNTGTGIDFAFHRTITAVKVCLQFETLLRCLGKVVQKGQKIIGKGTVQLVQDETHPNSRL